MAYPAARPSPIRPAQVADMLDVVATADREVAQVLDQISTSRCPVSRPTVTALEGLLTTLRPAADVRACLSAVDGGVLAAGIQLRDERHKGLRLVSSTAISGDLP